jgi:iron complex outermembrane recepter protein
VVDGIQRAFGVTNSSPITLTLRAIYGGIITAEGVDMTAGYRWSNDWARWGVSLDYTHVRRFALTDIPGFDLGLLDIAVFDAAGTTGDGNLVPSLPDNKGHLTFSWQIASEQFRITTQTLRMKSKSNGV